jgi:copper chaperone CopZ
MRSIAVDDPRALDAASYGKKEGRMTAKDIRIEGMHCDHCVMAVKKELSRIPGVQVHDVRIGSASLEYDETTVTTEKIKAAVEEAGYVLQG